MLTVVNDGRDIGGNDADAEGGNSDAETVPGSRATYLATSKHVVTSATCARSCRSQLPYILAVVIQNHTSPYTYIQDNY